MARHPTQKSKRHSRGEVTLILAVDGLGEFVLVDSRLERVCDDCLARGSES